MKKLRYTIECDFDEAANAEHVEKNERRGKYPLATDPWDWNYDDLVGAGEEEIISDVQIVDFEVLS